MMLFLGAAPPGHGTLGRQNSVRAVAGAGPAAGQQQVPRAPHLHVGGPRAAAPLGTTGGSSSWILAAAAAAVLGCRGCSATLGTQSGHLVVGGRRAAAHRRKRGGGGAAGAGRAGRSVKLAASALDSILPTIKSYSKNTADDMSRVKRAVESLNDVPKDALKRFVADWQVEWNSNNATGVRNTLLKFVSYNTLPNVLVSFFRSYLRVTADAVKIVTAFTIDGFESTDAAMVLAGKRGKAKGQTVPFQFDTVQLVGSSCPGTASGEMLESCGLAKFTKPTPVQAEPTEFTLLHVDDDCAVHRTSTGVTWVSSRILGTPKRPPIPFKID